MGKPHYVDQGTSEWWALRRGIPTASQFHRIVKPDGTRSKQATDYMYELIAERLLGETMDRKGGGKIAWVEHGMVTEAEAIEVFQNTHEMVLQKVSFFTSDDGRIGCSPDALVKGSVEAVEIKCPAPWTQIKYLLDGPGADYKQQVQGQMLVGGFQAVHFFTYHPQMPPFYRYSLRDVAFIEKMAEELDKFCNELDVKTEEARAKGEYIRTAGRLGVEELPGVFTWQSRSK